MSVKGELVSRGKGGVRTGRGYIDGVDGALMVNDDGAARRRKPKMKPKMAMEMAVEMEKDG
jgi:hypothetical protein